MPRRCTLALLHSPSPPSHLLALYAYPFPTAGIVIGETAIVGDNVSMLHHVTLGGSGTGKGVRHPVVGNGVLLGAGVRWAAPQGGWRLVLLCRAGLICAAVGRKGCACLPASLLPGLAVNPHGFATMRPTVTSALHIVHLARTPP